MDGYFDKSLVLQVKKLLETDNMMSQVPFISFNIEKASSILCVPISRALLRGARFRFILVWCHPALCAKRVISHQTPPEQKKFRPTTLMLKEQTAICVFVLSYRSTGDESCN